MSIHVDRREFVRHGGSILATGLAVANLVGPVLAQEATEALKIGFVGVGARGSCLLKILLLLKNVHITALCDIREDRVQRAQRWVTEAGQLEPASYVRGERDFERLCQIEDLDLVITATPWQWHVPICVAAMKAGKHAATEVPAATTLDDCWRLVDAAEQHNKQCVMLENYCYFRKAMLVLNMIRQGAFGELLHCEGRSQENWIFENWHIFNSNRTMGWVGEHLAKRNGNLYPTHGLGPMAMWANINRGDRFDHLVSMSSKSRALKLHAEHTFGQEHALGQEDYLQGDANITLARSVNGVTFTLYFGGQSPQPWSPEHKVQGTLGSCIGEMSDYRRDDEGWIQVRVFEKDKGARWGSYWDYVDKYDHPLWKKLGAEGKSHRHMDWSAPYDYLMLLQLTNALSTNVSPPMDVYDAATWSAFCELSERSVAGKSSVQDVPDFTRGKWKDRSPPDMALV